MKKFFLLLTITGSALYTIAQPLNKYVNNNNWSKYVSAALARNINSQLKTTAVHDRLQAVSTYAFDATTFQLKLNDSSIYNYSNGRGSTFDYNGMEYTDYGSSNSVMYDSSKHYMDNGNGMELVNGQKAGYDNNSTRTSFTELNIDQSSTLVNTTNHQYVYNIAGKIAAEYIFSWNTTANKWDSASNILYAYNSQGQLIADSGYSYLAHQLLNKTEYTLDGAGNQLQIDNYNWNNGWEPTGREIHSYYTNNNLETNISQSYVNGVWVNNTRDSFGFAATNLYNYHLLQAWDTASGNWANQDQEVRTLNTAGTLVMHQDMKNWDSTLSSWQDYITVDWTYNSLNNPVMASVTFNIFGTPTEVAQLHYYYEQYNDLHVADVGENNKMTVYPNPATNEVHVAWNNAATKTNLSLINMAGRTVYAAQVTGDHFEIPLTNIQPGVYRIIAGNEKDGIQFNQAIIKQ